MDILFTLLGLMGAALVVSMYFMLQQEKILPNSFNYFALNGLGGFLILVSIAVDFDITDLGGITIEAAWVVISTMGILKITKTRKKNK